MLVLVVRCCIFQMILVYLKKSLKKKFASPFLTYMKGKKIPKLCLIALIYAGDKFIYIGKL